MAIYWTFDCVTVVPDDEERLGHPWPVHYRSRGGRGNVALAKSSPMEATASLTITAAGPTPNAGWHRGRWRPSVERALITISSRDPKNDRAPSHAIHVDMEFVRSLRRGDTVNFALTGCAGLGVSVIRGDTLVAAAGAVTAVPLGSDLVVRYPGELIRAVSALFEGIDPDCQPPEIPIEITAAGERRLVYHGTRKLGPYRIYMLHGFYPGVPGTDECVAISRVGFSETAVNATAQLLERGRGERA